MEKRTCYIFGVVAILILPSTALAYLDPGTGSALIQGLIAAIAAIGVSIKLFWHRLVAMFSSKPQPDPSPVAEKTQVEAVDETRASAEKSD